jgi:hypothetical protein
MQKVEELKGLLKLAAGKLAQMPEFDALLMASANLDPAILEKLIGEVSDPNIGRSADWRDTKFALAESALLSAVLDPELDKV